MKTKKGINAMRQSRWAAVVAVGLVACAEDVGRDPAVTAGTAVTAEFDPTNPVPVLTTVPSPTGLAQDPATGNLVLESVAPEPCEGQNAAQCLAFAGDGGWPVSVFPTLFFEDFLDETSIEAGIRLIRLTGNPSSPFEEVPFVADQQLRAAPPAACQAQFGYSDADLPGGVEVTLQPTDSQGNPQLLLPGSRYFVVADRDLQALPPPVDPANLQGERQAGDNRPVEPSDLFFLLVVNGASRTDTSTVVEQIPLPVEPTEVPGQFRLNGPLRTQLEADVPAGLEAQIRAANPDFTDAQVDQAVQAALPEALNQSAASLFQLRTFFVQALAPLEAAGIVQDRTDLVFVNTWSTQPAPMTTPASAIFNPDPDPTSDTDFPDVPIPMAPIFTATVTGLDGQPDVINDVPPLVPGLGAALAGFNTLNGLSTVAPVTFNLSAPPDPASLQQNVIMVRYDPVSLAPLNPDGSSPPAGMTPTLVPVQVTAETIATGASVTVQPIVPLAEDAFFATALVGGMEGLQTTDGRPYVADSAFGLIRSFPEPLIRTTGSGALTDPNPAARVAVECSIFQQTGTFPPRSDPPDPTIDPAVATLAALEFEVDRARFQDVFTVFESLGVPRGSIALGYTYKTQDINRLVNQIDETLLDIYDQLPGDGQPAVVGPVVTATGAAARAAICEALCNEGYFEVPVPGGTPILRSACPDVDSPTVDPAEVGQLLAHPLCQINTSEITRLELYSVRYYDLLVGNPLAGAGTFLPESLDPMEMGPRITRANVWVVAGGDLTDTTPRPAAIFQHGITTTKEVGFLLANTLAAVEGNGGWAAVLPDLPFHGDRATDMVNAAGQVCPEVDPDDVICTPGTDVCMNGCDGTRDPDGTGFVSVNVFATRDALRQTTVDHLTLIRHLQSGAFNGDIPLDGDRIGFIGQSWGGVTGANTAAVAEELDAAVLNVAGGVLTNILLNSTPRQTDSLFQGLAALGVCELVDPNMPSAGCEDTQVFNLFLLLTQTILDPGDPFATSIGVPTGVGNENVLVQMIQPDGVVPNSATVALGVALGLFDPMGGMPISPNFQVFPLPFGDLDAGGCHGSLLSFVTDPDEDPNTMDSFLCGTDPTDAICNTYEIQQQAASFLADTDQVGSVPDIVDALFNCTD